MKILVTGSAGFIGMFAAQKLLARGDHVIGIDSLNDYYDPKLKQARCDLLLQHEGFEFHQVDIADTDHLDAIFKAHQFDAVLHLAAQAGVRYSLENPLAYCRSNLLGFTNILEACRRHQIAHLVYASTSSVYGGNEKLPFSERDSVDHPVSFYAATKRANELMAHSFSHLFQLPTSGLRFFTVYGPWGRPDMSPMIFARAILEGEPIKVFNQGDMARDFTYVEDIAEAVVRILDLPPKKGAPGELRPDRSTAPFRILNVGNKTAVNLLEYIGILESVLGKSTEKILLPMQAGDVQETFADVSSLEGEIGFTPRTTLHDGLARFGTWFKEYYGYS